MEHIFTHIFHRGVPIPAVPVQIRGRVVINNGVPGVIIDFRWNFITCEECGFCCNPNDINSPQAEPRWPWQLHHERDAHQWSKRGAANFFSCWDKRCKVKKVAYSEVQQHLQITLASQFCSYKEISCPFCSKLIRGQAPTYVEMIQLHSETMCNSLTCIPPCVTRGDISQIRECYLSHGMLKDVVEQTAEIGAIRSQVPGSALFSVQQGPININDDTLRNSLRSAGSAGSVVCDMASVPLYNEIAFTQAQLRQQQLMVAQMQCPIHVPPLLPTSAFPEQYVNAQPGVANSSSCGPQLVANQQEHTGIVNWHVPQFAQSSVSECESDKYMFV